MHENGGVFQKKKMREEFADLVCVTFFVYGDGQHWNHSSVKNVTNNVTVLAARLASQLRFRKLGEEFLHSYRESGMHRKYVVMEMLASMVHLARGEMVLSSGCMSRAHFLSGCETESVLQDAYKSETMELGDFLYEFL